MTCCGGGGSGVATLGSTRVAEYNFFATAPTAIGLAAPTVIGTATSRAIAATGGIYETTRRTGYVSAAAINSLGAIRSTTIGTFGVTTPGTGRFGGGGFRVMLEWAVGDAVLNPEARMFVGIMNSTAAPTAVDPTTLVQAIGFGCDSGETNLRVYAIGTAGNVTEIDLGASFPSGATLATASLAHYRATIVCRPGQTAQPSRFEWAVERVQTSAQASGVIDGPNAPTPLQTCCFQAWRATGPVNAAAVALEMMAMRFETQL